MGMFSKKFCARTPFKKNGGQEKKSKKEKPYNWDPVIRRMEKERRKSGIYIT